jgi:predicted nucleotidyltransferase
MVEKDILKRIVHRFKTHLRDNLVSIVLFGSRARGDAKTTSDYDLLIVAKDLPSSPLKRLFYVREPLQGDFKEKLSIIAKTKNEVESGFPSLFLDIGVDGVILYDRNFFEGKTRRIREIIERAGLTRVKEKGNFIWEWKNPPKKGWEITWNGYREL